MTNKNKTALITGAKQGIGKEIAISLAKENYNVVIADIDLAGCQAVVDEIQKLGFQAHAVLCDVSQIEDVKYLFKEAQLKFGSVDVLVNNAGIFPFVPFTSMTEENWDKVLDVNLKGTFLCSQEAAMILPENGRIINISSIASVVGFEGLVHYCASKGGVNGLTRALALELSKKKITVNAICPGAIETPGATMGSNEEIKKQTVAMIPLSRMGDPKDIANAVVFLASDKSNYITGQTIIIDGGWTLR